MAVLDITRLTVRQADTTVLADVTMAVEQSEIVGVMGPPGAGKTSLVEAVTGIRQPDHGTITLLGFDITTGAEAEREKAGLARTVDSGGLLGVATLREHLTEAYDRGGWAKRGRRLIGREHRPIKEVIEAMELSADADRPLGTLPLGPRRRFELALALAHQPAIIVVDGLMRGVRGEDARDFVRICRTVRDRGPAILVTDRNADFILRASDYVYVLDGGRVLARGDPASIRDRREVIAAFSRRSRSLVTPAAPDAPGATDTEITGHAVDTPARLAAPRSSVQRLESALAHFYRGRARGSPQFKPDDPEDGE